MEEEVRDHVHDARDCNGETEEPGDGEHVRIEQHPVLVALTPAKSVVRARRDQEHRRERGRDERGEEDVSRRARQLREPVREWHGEEESEQDLHARKRDAQLVQELDQLAVVSFLLAFGHDRSIPTRRRTRNVPHPATGEECRSRVFTLENVTTRTDVVSARPGSNRCDDLGRVACYHYTTGAHG